MPVLSNDPGKIKDGSVLEESGATTSQDQTPGFGSNFRIQQSLSQDQATGFGVFNNKGSSILENKLSKLSSYNTLISLSSLSPQEINNPRETFHEGIEDEKGLVIRSGGASTDKIQTAVEESLGINVEYFIDDLEIDAILSPGKKNKQSRATSVSFKVKEPYSAGLFLQTLQLASERKGYKSYFESPFLIRIEFEGWDSFGNFITSENEGLEKTTRLVPIQLVTAKFEIEGSGSVYEVEAVPWGEQPFTDEIQTLDSEVEISGSTVKEILSISDVTSSENFFASSNPKSSVMGLLNSDLFKVGGEDDNERFQSDEYAILFPKSNENPAISRVNEGLEVEENKGATKNEDDRNLKENREDFLGISSSSIGLGSRDIGIGQLEISINQAVSKFLSNDNNSNDIGNSSIDFDSVGKERKPFINPKEARKLTRNEASSRFDNRDGSESDSQGKVNVWQRGKMVIDAERKKFLFEKGMKVQDIIEELVILSDYGSNLLQQEPDSKGMKDWFYIQTETFIIDNARFETSNGRMPRLYVFKVVPFKVHEEHFSSPTKKPKGYEQLKKEVPKEYNYIYTGQNDDIIDFSVDINYAFYKPLQADLGNQTKDSKQQVFNEMTQSSQDPVNSQDPGDSETKARSDGPIGYSAGLTTGGKGGAINEDRKTRIARAFNEAIVNSDTDLINISLGIWGDPFFVPDTGLGNYTAGFERFNVTSDNTINYQNGEVDVLLNFRTPVDINDSGLLDPGDKSNGKTQQVAAFSGLYLVVKITSSFSSNKFTQSLQMVKRSNQELDESGQNVESVRENGNLEGSDESDPRDSRSNSLEDSGESNAQKFGSDPSEEIRPGNGLN